MSLWLEETVKLIKGSGIDIERVSYKSIIVVFYDHLSNRNLATLVATLFDCDENDVYFEIDKIINSLSKDDVDEICEVKEKLNQNDFDKWINSDEF